MKNSENDYDVIIIGAGPAGISTAIWCKELGLSVAILEKQASLGGQLLSIYNPIKNYPGMTAVNGKELCQQFIRSADSYVIKTFQNINLQKVDIVQNEATTATGEVFRFKTIVFATGVRRRRLGINGEDKFEGKGIIRSGTKDHLKTVGKQVMIVGGGDAAIENALILSQFAEQVTVIHRGNKLSARTEFLDAASSKPNIKILTNTTAEEFVGGEELKAVLIKTGGQNSTTTIAAQVALIRIGVEPNSEILPTEVHRDDRGYIVVDQYGRTNISSIFAAGDVANPVSPTIATAVGSGASTAKFIYSFLREKMDNFQKFE